VGSGPAAVRAVAEHRPDLALLDISMPGGGIAAAEEIGICSPETAVVMLTVSADESDLLAALRVGARGYLLKDTDPDRLALALRGVLDGEAAVPRTLVARLLGELRDRRPLRSSGAGPQPLSEREREVLGLLRRGLRTREVAAHLGIAEVTVRRHVSVAVRKLGVADRAAAIELVSRRARTGSGDRSAA
jgi:DNA-binding NarL/FixJ family response regulator